MYKNILENFKTTIYIKKILNNFSFIVHRIVFHLSFTFASGVEFTSNIYKLVSQRKEIILLIFRFPEMRTVTNAFVFNLAAADLLLAMTIPSVAYTRAIGNWKLGDIACKLVPYFQVSEICFIKCNQNKM